MVVRSSPHAVAKPLLAVLVLAWPSSAAAAPLTQIELRAIVLKSIRQDPASLEPAYFGVADRTLYYAFGGLRQSDFSAGLQRLSVPTATQYRVEAVRRFCESNNWGERSRQIMDTHLTRIEHVIGKELAAIEQYRGTTAELSQTLDEFQRQTDQLFVAAIRACGMRDGYSVTPYYQSYTTCYGSGIPQTSSQAPTMPASVTPVQDAAGRYRVEIRTEPDDGTVYFLTRVEYELAKSQGILNDDDTWHGVGTRYRYLYGSHYFRAHWPDGKSLKPYEITIEDNQPILLKPTTRGSDSASTLR